MRSRTRYDIQQPKFTQLWNSVSMQTKIKAGAAAIGLAAVAGWYFWPDRHETLAEWDPEYMNYCHSEFAESDLSRYSSVRGRLRESLDRLEGSSAAGARLTNELRSNDYVFCYGDKFKEDSGDIYYNRWIGTYFVEWDVSDRKVAEYLFNSEIRDFVGDVMWRENEYITEHALLWSRAKVAALQTAIMDASYYIYSGPGYGEQKPFETETWLSLESNAQTTAAAKAFRDVIEAKEYPDIREARLAAFNTVLQDHDAVYDSDYYFLSWYKEEVNEQSRQQSYPCGTNGTDTCWRTVYEDPSWYIHSEEMHPDTLVALSYAFFPEDGFIDIEDSFDILNNRANWRPTSTRTQLMFNQAMRNAEWHCRGHYREGNRQIGTGMDINAVAGSRFQPSID